MQATQNQIVKKNNDTPNLTKIQRLAAFLLMLDTDSAAELIKHLEPSEIEQITKEMTRLPLLSVEMQNEILREFSTIAIQAGACVCGSVKMAQAILEKSLGKNKALDILSRISPETPPPIGAIEKILNMDPTILAGVLKREQPQTIALITSYLPTDKASALLLQLPETLRDEVIERLATMEPTPIEVVENVAQILINKIQHSAPPKPPIKVGGVKTAASLMNAMDRSISKNILVKIESKNPEIANAIREKMFTFDDLIHLDTMALQKVLREIDLRELALALKGASEPLKKKLLGSISKRAAETVLEEISFLGSVKAKEIEKAKSKIMESVRRLDEEGEIDLAEALLSEKNAGLSV